jgi:opacity protein-like surface antigen
MLSLIFFLASMVPSAHAQKGLELTPFGGSRFGGIIDLSSSGGPTDFVTIKSSVNYGVIADYTLWDNFQPEFMWNRQPTMLATHDFATGTRTDLTSANLDMYQFGFVYSFRRPEARLKPFVVGGLGFTHFGYANPSATGVLDFSNRFSYNLGIGAKYFFNRYVGLRLEGRWSPSRTTTSPATFCSPYFGCYVASVANHAEQGQANIGIIFRFK